MTMLMIMIITMMRTIMTITSYGNYEDNIIVTTVLLIK